MSPLPATDLHPVSPRKPALGWVIWVMTVALTAMLVVNNAEFLFHHRAYEDGDAAANSLQVRRAKRFHEIHGAYSRWGFHHPGPAYFYVLALGEGLLHDAAGLTPTPFNAQVISTATLTTFFLSAGLVLFTRRLPRPWQKFFLPLSLGIVAWHFTVGSTPPAAGSAVFLSIWTAHATVLPFFCLVIAAASVASGGGGDLGYLVLAGGLLVHLHVAQPLFVVPLALLSYAGLLYACHVEGRSEPWAAPRRTGLFKRAYRRFPRAHGVAAVLLGLFLLPLVIDALHGPESNLSRILAHLKRNPGGHHPLARALCYFLQFGAYDSYDPGRLDFGRYDAAGMRAFVGKHWLPYALWGTVPLAFGGLAATVRPVPRFLVWFVVFLGAAVSLTMVWGMRQEGEMFYYNALFNAAIYGAAALLPAATLAALLSRVLPSGRFNLVPVGVSGLLFLLAGGVLWSRADRTRTGGYDDGPHLAVADAVSRGLTDLAPTADGGRGTPFILSPPNALDLALTVALQLDRAGVDFCVDDWCGNLFGAAHTPAGRPAGRLPTANWRIVAPGLGAAVPGARPTGYPDYQLDFTPAALDPAGGRIIFSQQGNFGSYSLSGWASTDADWTWATGRDVGLGFVPGPAASEVEMTLRAWPYTVPGKLDGQRVEVYFNDAPLGLAPLRDEDHPVTIRIPAALWNASPRARVRLRFPDAASPQDLSPGSLDNRLIGGGFRAVEFRLPAAP